MSQTISVSEINTYASCARRWYLTYKKNLGKLLEEIGPTRKGTVVHEALAVVMRYYYDNQDKTHPDITKATQLAAWAVSAWDKSNRPIKTTVNPVDSSEQSDTDFYERWEETLATATLLVQETIKSLKFPDRYTILNTDVFHPAYRPEGTPQPLIEYRIEYPIPNTDHVFVGVVDLVVYDRLTQHIVVVDWKTKKTFIEYDDEYMNQQLGLYQYVLCQMGLDVTHTLAYQIKSTIHTPSLNKDGSMSRRNITTTWDRYEQALLDNNLNPDDYLDMRDKLAENELFRPLVVYRSEVFLKNLWANVVSNVYRLLADTTYPLAMDYVCHSCPFQPLCKATMEGQDTDELINGEYILRKIDDVRSYTE